MAVTLPTLRLHRHWPKSVKSALVCADAFAQAARHRKIMGRCELLKLGAVQTELTNYFRWYNEARPHQSLGGRTPNEVYMGLAAARAGPKFESRPRLLKPSERRRANDRKVVPVDNLKLVVQYLESRRHLPIVGLKRAA